MDHSNKTICMIKSLKDQALNLYFWGMATPKDSWNPDKYPEV